MIIFLELNNIIVIIKSNNPNNMYIRPRVPIIPLIIIIIDIGINSVSAPIEIPNNISIIPLISRSMLVMIFIRLIFIVKYSCIFLAYYFIEKFYTLNLSSIFWCIGLSDAVLIGFGRIGYAVALNFFRSNLTLTVVDSDPRKLKYAFQVFGFNISNINVLNLSELDRFKRYNLAITCLPGSISYRVINKLVDLGVNVVDVSYFPEDPWNLHELAVKRNVKLVVDAGFAPGLSNIVLGYFHAKSGGLRCARIYVGGLSENPIYL